MKRRHAGWPPPTSAKQADKNVAQLDRAVAEQEARRPVERKVAEEDPAADKREQS